MQTRIPHPGDEIDKRIRDRVARTPRLHWAGRERFAGALTIQGYSDGFASRMRRDCSSLERIAMAVVKEKC